MKTARGIAVIAAVLVMVWFLGCPILVAAEEPLEEKVEKYILQGDYEGAINMLKAYIDRIKDIEEKKRNLGIAYYHLARTYFQTGFDGEAEENLQSAYLVYPRLAVEQQENDLYFKEKAVAVKQKVARQLEEQYQSAPVEEVLTDSADEDPGPVDQKPEKSREQTDTRFVAPVMTASSLVSKSETREMVNKSGYYDRYLNRKGGYANRYRMVNTAVVHDQASGLMWMVYGSPGKVTMEEGMEWLMDQNRKGYAGYSDWRFPTLSEALTLVEEDRMLNEKADYWKKLNIDPIFGLQDVIWTATRESEGIYWIVSFDGGFTRPHDYLKSFEYTFYVRGVRTAE